MKSKYDLEFLRVVAIDICNHFGNLKVTQVVDDIDGISKYATHVNSDDSKKLFATFKAILDDRECNNKDELIEKIICSFANPVREMNPTVDRGEKLITKLNKLLESRKLKIYNNGESICIKYLNLSYNWKLERRGGKYLVYLGSEVGYEFGQNTQVAKIFEELVKNNNSLSYKYIGNVLWADNRYSNTEIKKKLKGILKLSRYQKGCRYKICFRYHEGSILAEAERVP